MEETDSRVEVYVTTDTSEAPHKADEPRLWVMYDAAKPEAGKLYFTEAEWDAFVLGVKDGGFDLDKDGTLPPVPEAQRPQQQSPSLTHRNPTVASSPGFAKRSGIGQDVPVTLKIWCLDRVGQGWIPRDSDGHRFSFWPCSAPAASSRSSPWRSSSPSAAPPRPWSA